MPTVQDIKQFKATKDLFTTLNHSERAAILAFFSATPLKQTYALTSASQVRMLFTLLYNVQKRDDIISKIERLAKSRPA